MATLPFELATFIGPDRASEFSDFLQHAESRRNVDLLGDIPRRSQPSFEPLAILSALLYAKPGPWPILELQRTYTELWKLLPEHAKSGRVSREERILLDLVLRQCKTSYPSLLALYDSESPDAAIIDPETSQSASHRDVATVVRDFHLPVSSATKPKPVIAISLPNGPLLALTVLATATYYTAAPVAHGSGVGKDQFKADVLQSHSNIVIASASDVSRLSLRDPWLAEAGIQVVLAELTDGINLTIRDLDGRNVGKRRSQDFALRPVPNTADDTAILLFTSGTSGTKKLVPLSIHSMVSGVAMVVESWGLSRSTRCLNQMPLNHVGGLIRNLFAPIFSGGSVICCSGFDANLFWDCVEDFAPTWYYASPSMHQCILEAGMDRPESMAKSQIKLICNAAGGLLPSLAIQLRDTFSTKDFECTVLPSYGMTECMPISTPPLDYRLEKTGTSGISVGPEITILDGRDHIEVPGVVGRICVRGAPVFGGYLKEDNLIDTSCFTADGWFDTGDMGYLDQGGYLYITGRSKEVINRGGELISPFEVEEAIVAAASRPDSTIFGRVSKALAFSVTHDVLQEVVGIAVVTPEGAHRACLRGIQEAVKSVLNSVKIPVLIVYMDDGLPTNNNKILRIKLADRLGLPEISDNTKASDRYFEAEGPPPNAPLTRPIPCRPLQPNHDCLKQAAATLLTEAHEAYVRNDASGFYPDLIIAPFGASVLAEKEAIDVTDLKQLVEDLYSTLDGYDCPLKARTIGAPFPRLTNGQVDEVRLAKLLDQHVETSNATSMSSTETVVARVFAQILSKPVDEISETSDFFELGGDSMGAGKLLNALRKEYPLRLPINVLFANSVVSQLAHAIDEKMQQEKPLAHESSPLLVPELLPGCEETRSSTHPILLIIQLLPLLVFWPMKRALTWSVFMYMLTTTQFWYTNKSVPGRLLDLVISMAVGRAVTRIVSPFVAIAFKWIVVGRYQEGLYPMWGRYHTRWWLVEKVTAICGKGVFGMSNISQIWYYRLLGAKIGTNVKLSKGAKLGEWDLISIGDDVVLDRCTIRPFAVERNTSMYLGRIKINAKASLGLGAIIAAGSEVPAAACIGPNSSSWEVAGADESNRDLNSTGIPGAHWALKIFVGLPLSVVKAFIQALPWLACLVALVLKEPNDSTNDMLRSVLIWFSSRQRVGYHYLALAAHAAFAPAFGFACVLLIKKTFDCVYGRITPSAMDTRSQMTKFRMEFVRSMMSASAFHKLTELFGTHYATTSVLARAMGAKVGQRVYWPGTGPSIQDFDLLEIGDDVVFGSRSHLVTSDAAGSDYVRIQSGAMVADRVVLLPGSELGEKTVMGSGALAKRGKHYAAGTTWVGSKNNEAICLTAEVPRQAETGHRATQYYETINNLPPNFSAINSTATTLVRQNVCSERSSMHLIEKGSAAWPSRSPSYADIDRLNYIDDVLTPGVSRKTSVTVHALESSASSISGLPRDTKSSAIEMVTLPVLEAASESSSPFGRAFYEGKASYRVWSQGQIFIYSTLVAVSCAVWWNAGSIAAVQVVGNLFRHNSWMTKSHGFLSRENSYRPLALYIFFWAVIVAIMAVQSMVIIIFTILAKWILMGRRSPGNYDWDKSSYCQRWQLFLKLETFRRHCYSDLGILGLLTGTNYIVMYFRALGANIGSDCALFASGAPSLMFTEPDLLTIGDRVAVDDASLVGHINTRGKFDLNPLHVGSRSVLRTGSRLLSGARMEEDSCLLEHTLVMAGDVVDARTTVQGWPAEEFKGKRMPTLEVGQCWRVATKDTV